jgi:hypothetical protein
MKKLVALLGCAIIGGCVTAEAPVYLRTDGKRVADHPDIRRQFDIDRTICEGEAAKADASPAPLFRRQQAWDAMFNGCMAQRGYMLKTSL